MLDIVACNGHTLSFGDSVNPSFVSIFCNTFKLFTWRSAADEVGNGVDFGIIEMLKIIEMPLTK